MYKVSYSEYNEPDNWNPAECFVEENKIKI